jgi:hypothetical protein
MEFEKLLKVNSTYFYVLVVKNENEQHSSLMKSNKSIDTLNLQVFIRFMIRFITCPILEKRQDYVDLPTNIVQVQQQQGNNSYNYPSFRYDRRMIRCIIAKYWIDGIILRWLKYNNVDREE